MMGIVEALGGECWFNIYAGLFLCSLMIIAVSLVVIAFKI